MMDEQILGAEQDFEMCISSNNQDPKQRYFNDCVMALQEMMLDQQFQSTQTCFMMQNCDFQTKSAAQFEQLFNTYRYNISQLLNKKINKQVQGFDIFSFATQLKGRIGQVHQQMAQVVLSCVDIQAFKSLLNDYKLAQQEQQRYKVLTIKTNKIPQNKKVKGNSQNIFGSSNLPTFGNKNSAKKAGQKVVQKSLDQLLVPQTVLTVKGLRKC